MPFLRLSNVLNHSDTVSTLPEDPKSEEERPVLTYILNNTIRNKILSYKETVDTLIVNDTVFFSLNSEPYDCHNSKIGYPTILTKYFLISNHPLIV